MLNGVGGIGSHTLPNKGLCDIWLTPKSVLMTLGEFDLDPCAAPSPRPWETARNVIELPQDGLKSDWYGRVWLNPPYGRDIGLWMEKIAHHGRGIALTFARTETEAWQRWIWPYARAVLFIAGRLSFARPDGSIPTTSNAGGPSALIAYSISDEICLRHCGIKGVLVKPVERAEKHAPLFTGDPA